MTRFQSLEYMRLRDVYDFGRLMQEGPTRIEVLHRDGRVHFFERRYRSWAQGWLSNTQDVRSDAIFFGIFVVGCILLGGVFSQALRANREWALAHLPDFILSFHWLWMSILGGITLALPVLFLAWTITARAQFEVDRPWAHTRIMSMEDYNALCYPERVRQLKAEQAAKAKQMELATQRREREKLLAEVGLKLASVRTAHIFENGLSECTLPVELHPFKDGGLGICNVSSAQHPTLMNGTSHLIDVRTPAGHHVGNLVTETYKSQFMRLQPGEPVLYLTGPKGELVGVQSLTTRETLMAVGYGGSRFGVVTAMADHAREIADIKQQYIHELTEIVFQKLRDRFEPRSRPHSQDGAV